MLPDDTSFITDEVSLRRLHHQPDEPRDRQGAARSSIGIAAGSSRSRRSASSPRKDRTAPTSRRAAIRPGFVRELDERTLLLPDRVGNNRLDAMTNLLVNPRIGVLFLVPGMNETLRINGTARITDDARLLAASAINGRAPKVGLVIAIEEAFLHCPKALIRSGALGSDAAHRPRDPAELRADAARSCRRPDRGRE